jgi:hypothetical protein
MDKLTVDSDTHPFWSNPIGSGALYGVENLSRQVLDFARYGRIAKYPTRQAVAARIL